uniref:Alkyl hydroperoxide reductase subunit C/ Thiol specific antioxidant domain-containing protein n=1 Tax=uncultured Nocardioidaceae bacterium TaxID=253824 RepID=A0A6J4LSA4_9ACTN|nr:MAG: hypothetical protein AVDCRST_MAG46-1842 [uncultured Nocardioidaceae bacterium]
MHESSSDPRITLVFVGFSPPERLKGLARHLGWPGPVLSDEPRRLYATLGVGRAPLWRLYNPGTLRMYWRALVRGKRPRRPAEDTRQLGADAVVVDGTVVRLWRPRSPDDRPDATAVVDEAARLLPE